ncbi:MAG: STAS domain-containing protein [Chloroflexi bacterium]|nr:STAS domain-containing protein [Chloroflexota bacterium]
MSLGYRSGLYLGGRRSRLTAPNEEGREAAFDYDAAALADPDLGTIDALARLQLIARRHGQQLRLCRASADLQALIALLGLSDTLPCREV